MTIATDMLASYLAAEAAVLSGKTISFNGRQHALEDLESIRKGRLEWERRVNAESNAGAPTFGGLSYSLASFDGEQR